MEKLACFKAYDIRGKLGEELNGDIAYRIGRAYAQFLKPQKVVVGGDVRVTSEALKMALVQGLLDEGCHVVDLGLAGTEEVYFATFYLELDGGIEVTASHNPIDYNGMKLVREGSRPVSGDTGLREIQSLVEENEFGDPLQTRGTYQKISVLDDYIDHLLSYVDLTKWRPAKMVMNSGNGAAGHVVDALEHRLIAMGVPISFVKVHNEPDGGFPNGIPNPLLPENRKDTSDAVIVNKASMGVAWDGDFDRCFLFDETGQFIEGYYIVAMLAKGFLNAHPGSKIIYDPRLTWNTEEEVSRHQGIAVKSKTGHAFIKERMRSEDAIYGGEMSAHHYFRDFAYCDSGMIPWLMVMDLLMQKGASLGEEVAQMMSNFPSSGEINRRVQNADVTIETIFNHFVNEAIAIDHTDGIGLDFEQWRFNLRKSNTEPVIRLNVESRGNADLMKAKTAEILDLIEKGE
ncbi:phosphomannomutase CpsG [Echinimonas agarilytica]|uniref:phosphomannomutase n=1 Tax=Echinimonas agarilytica TaxID=1215918 RepID=A0AA42B8S9_9GAMM|nr:phosphomannomutase CpsG [Echinimonas agarilytica]